MTTFVFSQSNPTAISIDDRLFEVYDRDYLENLRSQHPVLIERWNFYLDNAWYITDYPSEKGNDAYPVISIPNLKEVNILLLEKQLGLKRAWKKRTVYKIAETDKVLVYHSGKTFTERLNEHLGRKH